MAKQIATKIVADHVEEAPEVSEIVNRRKAEADHDIAAGTVTPRWGREQVAVVKRAAVLMGVPYRTHLKHVVFKRTMAEIERVEAGLILHR